MSVSRRNQIVAVTLASVLCLVAGNGSSAAETTEGTWSNFAFSAGQFFKYELTSERGLKGWVSIAVAPGADEALDITLAGDWNGEFSETITLQPDMTPFDFVYSAEDFQIPNAMGSLLLVDAAVLENAQWKDGFAWSEGDKSMEVSGSAEYAGVKGMLLTYTSTHFATKKTQTKTYSVNPDLPLPIFVEVPAANDTWRYELVEIK